MSAPAEHDQDAADIIAAELVACTLGHRRRPELRVDATGIFARLTQDVGRLFADFGDTIHRAFTIATTTTPEAR